MVRLEAPPLDRKCTHCSMSPRTYHCKDCFPQNFLCARCCISGHSTQPFHRIQKFVDGCFEHYDLDMLGLVLDICPHTGGCLTNRSPSAGHIPGNPSDDDEWEDDDNHSDNDINIGQSGPEYLNLNKIVVIASTGILKRSVQWCKCPNAPEKHIQLLRSRLFPATFTNPKTAFTFDVLDDFRLDALECNTSALNFMSKLARRTHPIFPGAVPVAILCSI